LVPLSVPEIGRLLLSVLTTNLFDIDRLLHWSFWRRHHQAIARRCHYQARAP
jgi:hypothetical protein